MSYPATLTHRNAAAAAVGRAVIIGRAAVAVTAGGVALRLAAHPGRAAIALLVVGGATALSLIVLSRHPQVVRYPVPILALDFAVCLGVFTAGRGGDQAEVAGFCYAMGACALAGVLIGGWSVVPAIGHAAVGFLIAATVLRVETAPGRLASFVVAFPAVDLLAAVGAAAVTAGLARYVGLSVAVVASAQRTAVASERQRLARELHDSVTATLRGVSLAALELPRSLRRQPALAERLARTVSLGATTAVEQARELVAGLRVDDPDTEFSATLERICGQWSDASGVPVSLLVDPVAPPTEVRYQVGRILQEALRNVARHAGASQVEVTVYERDGRLRIRIGDDGEGFPALAQRAGQFGIAGMRERAELVGGSLRVTSQPGAGTVVEAVVPSVARVE